eukprot:TRINITY_DN67799_c8_g7_i1.p1 TRINITY_DN67799_c8_g7~~TRINITY_DN67799_c8_g7_i1.p1  ORF type:complete len:194 (+),score=2.74 TRINITY_DN67799_c8_g7_i1:40-621(+)
MTKPPPSGKYLNTSTAISYNGMSFLIIDCPADTQLPAYVAELRRHNCKHLVRACEATYQPSPLVEAGMTLHDLQFPDGEPPPKRVIEEWLKLIDQEFPEVAKQKKAKGAKNGDDANGNDIPIPTKAIAVHCQAGLGRAPALVAIALIERAGLMPLDAISFIRERRKGALNSKQMAYLTGYKKVTPEKSCCVIL